MLINPIAQCYKWIINNNQYSNIQRDLLLIQHAHQSNNFQKAFPFLTIRIIEIG